MRKWIALFLGEAAIFGLGWVIPMIVQIDATDGYWIFVGCLMILAAVALLIWWPERKAAGALHQHNFVPIDRAPTPTPVRVAVPVASPAPEKRQLSTREVERKLTVVDTALDQLGEIRDVIKRGRKLHQEEWHDGSDRSDQYPNDLQKLISDLAAIEQKRHDLLIAKQEYPDIVATLKQVVTPARHNQIADFMNHCRALMDILRTAPAAPGAAVMHLYTPHRNAFKDTLNAIDLAQGEARDALYKIRKELGA